tara:strand:+ start:1235 stop:1837 length:603 start_codon:yes stop_codon:yes gene_type:complete
MLDQRINKIIHPIMNGLANLIPRQISANSITLAGFTVGTMVVPFLWLKLYSAAMVVILVNRFFDALDGAVARKCGTTNLGGYLDITCDFIFYSVVVMGFALADPERNGLAAAFLIFSFTGTGSSFLAFSAAAKKQGLTSETYGPKSFYYLGGLTEGTETILFFVVVCIYPSSFPVLAVLFSCICWITVLGRFRSAFTLLR